MLQKRRLKVHMTAVGASFSHSLLTRLMLTTGECLFNVSGLCREAASYAKPRIIDTRGLVVKAYNNGAQKMNFMPSTDHQ